MDRRTLLSQDHIAFVMTIDKLFLPDTPNSLLECGHPERRSDGCLAA
jgi:hypothetical protein